MGSRRLASLAMAAAGASEPVICKLLVCGGGAGGCSIAAKFASKLGPGGCVVVEPSDTHYYQPMWTMVGGGMKTMEQSARPMESVLPKEATWVKDSVDRFYPEVNKVVTANGLEIRYEFMVVAMGLDLHYEAIPGLEAALQMKDSGVCSNYSHKYAEKTLQSVMDFKKGNAIFTYPTGPIKCAGAPQKACYITEALLRKLGKRKDAKVKYNTSLPVIFGVKKYADRLWEVVKKRDIEVGLKQELISIKPEAKEAVFRTVGNAEERTESYEMLHVCPPMSAPRAIKKTSQLTDYTGFLNIDKRTLRHCRFNNVFGIGDCTNLPTSKTAAAVAGQNGVLGKNLAAAMKGKPLTAEYDGYTSCPLVTDLNKCILAEFDYNQEPLETFPWDQGKERYSSFLLKKEVMPQLYWHGLLKGYWNGPGIFRNIFHLGLK